MYTLAYFGLPGGAELIILLVIVLVLFGKRLPGAMHSVGRSITEFKKGVNEGVDDADGSDDSDTDSKKQED
ncbi:MAG: twin-arginine translocase TatA/TatE family subunit [Planctomycetaceae bacterium]|nr:twin-arginine translocase TatA/TatE family subunit [Planctomycetaceae bacterium]